MLKTKRFLGIVIISIFLLFNLCTNCYAFIIDVNVDGIEMQLEYTSPSLDENDIAEIKQEAEEFVQKKQSEADEALKEETLEKIKNKIELLIREKEEEKKRDTERDVLRQMEKEYRANKIPNAGDTTMLVLKTITVVSVIALAIVIVCSKKMKK